MGFAGQLFAARVAIGLAVPSPQAMSKAGGALAKGIEDIYKQAQLAKNRGGLNYAARLQLLNNKSTTAMDKMNNEVRIRLERNLEALNKATSSSVANNFNKIKGHYGKLKSVLSKPMRDSLFGGVGGKGGMEGQLQIAANMQKMDAAGRAEVIRNQGKVIAQSERELTLEKEKFIELEKQGEKKAAEAKTQREKLGKLQEELQIQKDIKQNFEDIDNEITGITSDYGDLNTKAADFRDKVLGTADAMRNKFNEALRTSVSLLTVVGYKLNQNTQELIEFERELLNANSVFNLTNDELFRVGNTVTEFGNKFGIAVHNGAEGLYQLASAGLEANEAMSILPETLKLSMAVQGDHNTISKLTAQTLFGFGMEMDQAALLTDKFAFAIQKSLIEYQDLSSAVKFALPFFTSTGQSIDQLLGALQILTNRALEAGIAGRGLRQALAEFAESALDSEVGFRKMGVEILNAQGEMLQLSEIAAQFAAAVGPETSSNTELLTTLIQDLNVRGATAFIHLVQASDEFTQAVKDTENAGGQLDEMVKIQNASLQAQVQILKNNVASIFAFRDASYEGTEFLNGFHEAVHNLVNGFKDQIIVTKDGKQQLTEFGENLQDMATGALYAFSEMFNKLLKAFAGMAEHRELFLQLFELTTKFFGFLADVVDYLANTSFPGLNRSLLEMVVIFKTLSMLGVFKLVGSLGSIGRGLMSLGGMAGVTGRGAANAAATGLKRVGLGGAASRVAGQLGGRAMLGRTAIAGAARLGAGVALGATGGLALYGGAYALDKSGLVDVPLVGEGRANGGYVRNMANGGYVVGEQGPELFVPGQAGQVLNKAQTDNMMEKEVVFRNARISIDSFGGLA